MIVKYSYIVKKETKGVTLVALVVTIIVLLILAGITINLVVGDKGIFSRTKSAVDKYKEAEEKEQEDMAKLYDELQEDKDLPENTENTEAGTIVKMPEEWKTTIAGEVSTENGKEVKAPVKIASVYAVSTGKGETIPVPIGFYYVGGTRDTGVVISDQSKDKYENGKDKTSHEYASELVGNQFVWIPCTIDEYKKINWNKENGKWDMETNISEYEQIKKYSGFYIGRYEAGVATLDKETNTFKDNVTFLGGKSLYNSVAIQTGLHNWGWQNYDYTARQSGTVVGTGSNKATGNVVIKANSIPYYHADYYTAVEMSRRLYDNNAYVYSGLVTGTQWDMMIKYLQDKGANVTSSNWGNYDNVELSGLRGYYTNVTTAGTTDGFKSTTTLNKNNSSTYILLTTGATEMVKENNLYDVSGNLWEWTQEASYSKNVSYNNDETLNTYMLRGGSFPDACAAYPACYRAFDYAPITNTHYGFRLTLYIK